LLDFLLTLVQILLEFREKRILGVIADM